MGTLHSKFDEGLFVPDFYFYFIVYLSIKQPVDL